MTSPLLKRTALVVGLAATIVATPAHQVLAATKTAGKTPTKKTLAAVGTAVIGTVVDTRWGPVQVSVSVANHKITNISVPIYPHTKHRSAEINTRALPILHTEVITAQSARINNVSGATVTWEGYTASLQKAIDTAQQQGVL